MKFWNNGNVNYGSNFSWVINFADFSSIPPPIFQYFFIVLCNELNKYKNLFNK